MLTYSFSTLYHATQRGKIKDFLRENCEHQLEIDYVDYMKNCEINTSSWTTVRTRKDILEFRKTKRSLTQPSETEP